MHALIYLRRRMLENRTTQKRQELVTDKPMYFLIDSIYVLFSLDPESSPTAAGVSDVSMYTT